eukprot:TRINITY_DN36636_c0_g1_i1.p1 TRINITY_DN36636_c0_g1~~TRINITY_DN36636_c0_g1_i1.p1  ORF type:complete len:181 (+),score=16.46 TRINITY_DN36636_c0_g1_i1:42-584(+)
MTQFDEVSLQEVQPTVVVNIQQAEANSSRAILTSSILCISTLVMLLVMEYYLYIFGKGEGEHTSSTVGYIAAIVLASIASVLGCMQIRNLPEESRHLCRIGITITVVVFCIASAILMILWVHIEDGKTHSDNEDTSYVGIKIALGCLLQAIVILVVLLCFCFACLVSYRCKPPSYQNVDV